MNEQGHRSAWYADRSSHASLNPIETSTCTRRQGNGDTARRINELLAQADYNPRSRRAFEKAGYEVLNTVDVA